jgi:hypothetical protein
LVPFYRAGYGLGLLVFVKNTGYDKKIGALFYLLTIYRVKVTFTKRQVMYSIKQIGFARPVVTREGIHSLAENKFGLLVIFKIDN